MIKESAQPCPHTDDGVPWKYKSIEGHIENDDRSLDLGCGNLMTLDQVVLIGMSDPCISVLPLAIYQYLSLLGLRVILVNRVTGS